jgi:hypothetical protein
MRRILLSLSLGLGILVGVATTAYAQHGHGGHGGGFGGGHMVHPVGGHMYHPGMHGPVGHMYAPRMNASVHPGMYHAPQHQPARMTSRPSIRIPSGKINAARASIRVPSTRTPTLSARPFSGRPAPVSASGRLSTIHPSGRGNALGLYGGTQPKNTGTKQLSAQTLSSTPTSNLGLPAPSGKINANRDNPPTTHPSSTKVPSKMPQFPPRAKPGSSATQPSTVKTPQPGHKTKGQLAKNHKGNSTRPGSLSGMAGTMGGDGGLTDLSPVAGGGEFAFDIPSGLVGGESVEEIVPVAAAGTAIVDGGQAQEGIEGGVLLSEVRKGGAADQAGLRAGDVILRFGGVRTHNFEGLRDAVQQASGVVKVVFLNGENNEVEYVTVEPVDGLIGVTCE